uniref:LAM_G_DOMAIN domain-containing protein n=1 Tax=Meloidogyne hapla TaxID=6305 RepID=A0A1I8BMQ4_MELHA
MAGAPGGYFIGKDGDSHKTWADRLAVNLHLNAGQQVKLFLGQQGKCICDKNMGEKLLNDRKDLHDQLCSLSIDDLLNVSCSDGGASIFFVGSHPVVVAAGGSGDFPTVHSGVGVGAGYQGGFGGLPDLPGSAFIRTRDFIGYHLILPKSNSKRAYASVTACPQRDCPSR